MKRFAIIIAAACCLACAGTQEPLSEQVVRSQMQRTGGDPMYLDYREGEFKWNYTPGLELKAYLDVYDAYGDGDILEYVLKWYDAAVNEDGSINTYSVDKYSVDLVCAGKSFFRLYELTGDEKYLKAEDLLKSQLDSHPRTSEGALWHKLIYPHQIWLDGVYMAEPFLVEYAARRTEGEEREAIYREVINEFLVAAEHTYDPETMLYRHAWDESRSMFWCEPGTGRSDHCWGRALGWLCMAIVDVCEYIPEGFEGREQVLDILRGIAAELPEWADPDSGVWYQVLDRPGREGNYLESTCSAMFAYALLKGVRMGWLDAGLEQYARDTYANVLKAFVTADEGGLLTLHNCCSVGGLGGKQMRRGDYEYYLSEPVRDNDSKGIGPLVRAALEMEKR